MRHLTSRLKAGVEINARADEIGLVANWRVISETQTRPAVIFGTSSDRIGTPRGQSWFVTASKNLQSQISFPVAPYVGLSYSGYENRWLVPFGVSVAFPRGISLQLMNDGVHSHLAATYARTRWSATLLAIRRSDLGMTFGVRF